MFDWVGTKGSIDDLINLYAVVVTFRSPSLLQTVATMEEEDARSPRDMVARWR